MDEFQFLLFPIYFLIDEYFFDNTTTAFLLEGSKRYKYLLCSSVREEHYRIEFPENIWMDRYNELIFYQLLRVTKQSFNRLLDLILEADVYHIVNKKYRGGNTPVSPKKSLLCFLWYIGHQDTLNSISHRFNIVPSTLMHIVNAILYLVNRHLKKKFIVWPKSEAEFEHIVNGFQHYPGVVGAVDGSHIPLKVPVDQHDSYVDRYMSHSINLMAICNHQKLLIYIFVGYPGSAHDSRVFSNSRFVRNIEAHGSHLYFPSNDHHIIGDAAFPLRHWLMTPYRRTANMNARQRNHNKKLSSDRVVIENCFGIIKGRFRRLQFINTYTVAKAIEITTAACVIHNFCYLNFDEWDMEIFDDIPQEIVDNADNIDALANMKRDRIAVAIN